MKTIKELNEIKDSLKYILSSDFNTFEEYYQAKRKIEQPLKEWAYNLFKNALSILGIHTIDAIFRMVYKMDNDLCLNPHKFGTKEYDDFNDEVCTIYKDDEYSVKAILDYDCDTTLCKYVVTHNPSGLFHRDAIDLGTKYLSSGIQIVIGE